MDDDTQAENMRLHPVPGTVSREEVLPPKGRAALTLAPGETLRFVDLEGKQVPDLACFDPDDLGDYLHLANSINLNGRMEFREGDVLYSVTCRPMMTITGYSNEESFAYGSMCSEELNRIRYGIPDAPNCRDSIAAALKPWGIERRRIPNAFVPFMLVRVGPGSKLEIHEPTTVPGDFYDLRAEMPLVVGISNCPQENNPCNGFKPTAMGLILYGPD
jgi:uncharacterized protein